MRPESRTVPELAEALPALAASLREDPSPRNVVRVAEAHWLAGSLGRAIELLEPLVRADRGAISPRILLGWCYAAAGRDEEAARVFAEAAALDPANPYARPARLSQEEAALGSGRGRSAAKSEVRGAGAPPEDLEREAEPEAALRPEELRQVPPDPLYSATLAEIFERQGFQEKAIEIYREVVRLHPERDDVRERLERLEARMAGDGPA